MDANMQIKVGDRVEAGEGDDHDTGVVSSIDGDMAFILWDSLVDTPCPVSELRRI